VAENRVTGGGSNSNSVAMLEAVRAPLVDQSDNEPIISHQMIIYNMLPCVSTSPTWPTAKQLIAYS